MVGVSLVPMGVSVGTPEGGCVPVGANEAGAVGVGLTGGEASLAGVKEGGGLVGEAREATSAGGLLCAGDVGGPGVAVPALRIGFTLVGGGKGVSVGALAKGRAVDRWSSHRNNSNNRIATMSLKRSYTRARVEASMAPLAFLFDPLCELFGLSQDRFLFGEEPFVGSPQDLFQLLCLQPG